MDSFDEAVFMIHTFESVDCDQFDVTVTNVDQQKVSYLPGRSVGGMKVLLQHLIPACRLRQENVILRPERVAYGVLAQLDDLDSHQLERVASRGFLSLETSPKNYQTWMAIAGGTDDLIRRLVRGVGVDWNASRSVRIAGSTNCKRKYAPNFPEVHVVDSYSGHLVTPRDLEDLLAPVAPPPPPRRLPAESGGWPDYDDVLRGAPARNDGQPDRSSADFFWCKWALERGNGFDAVAAKLLEVSEKAREQCDRGNQVYISRTVEAAMNAK